ncbi:helix-turn-helix domain-containing protein [Clostridium perfringens]|uniref:helix-turn-helix domain-containing protein n=1 Tax=Clostridium perfringens TaxID=1502 RepID=UPI001A32D83F|nr:helix-turn-helix transcriptional regulator [Clostridium perfringens]MCX0392330.1 helix-turn-helix transcriptional regulator [Clostridium perfringens]MDK0693746.1 helix-turn-helix transcriptional regulator [Clostridium perfringens]MDK0732098.1 helix-turn-helix transcriptional regulator [Clostridium perfringens]MDK0740308.1 helix-turn-helix transcriptional regulator [Clostridium perfringens]MDK0984822.1 helix-turn-helix transcriptional regulator [Clostridium perfringens]
MKIGTNLQRIRKSKDPKITQQDLAKATGLSRSYLSDVEHNRYNPSLDTTIDLANVLGGTLNELVYDIPTTNNPKLNSIINTITNSDLDAKQLELLELYLTALIRD